MKNFIIVLLIMIFTSCEKETNQDDLQNPGNNDKGEWLIPSDEIFDGGPGKDGIPALENPLSGPSTDSEHDYLEDSDLILAVDFAGNKKAYPHPVLDWHEIANDEISDKAYAVNYCPLTGTGMAWNRILNGEKTSFGVSGLLYNTNLILYDRLTDSYWSQMSLMSVKGELSGQFPEIYPMIEMKWETWKELYPDEQTVIPPDNYSRPYGSYPYGEYKTNNDYLLFPVSVEDNRLPQKERVFAVVGDKDNARIYRYNQNAGEYVFIRDEFLQMDYIVAGINRDFLVAWKENTMDGDKLKLNIVENKLPVLFKDESGSEWDIFGNAISGSNKGKKLEKITFINGFWFTFPSFFNNVEIHAE